MGEMVNWKSFTVDDYLKVLSLENAEVNELVRYLKTKPHIEKLYICCKKIKVEESKALSCIKSVDSISVRITDADDKSVKALSEMTNLTSLNVERHCLTSEGAKELSKCTNLKKLVVHKSTIDQIDEESIKRAASIYVESLAKLNNLTELKLKDNLINDEFVKLLADANCLHNLVRLELSENNIGNLAASALAKSVSFPNLTDLVLKKTKIGFEGANALALSCKLKNLQVVNLYESELCDVGGIEELSKCRYSKTKPNFILNTQLDIFHECLMKVLSNKMAVREILEADKICSFTKWDPHCRILKYLLTQKEKYELRLNLVLKSCHRLCIFHSFLGQPEAEKFLFEHGALPAAIFNSDIENESALQVITEVSQSVHMTPVVKKTNFFTKYLVDQVNTTKEQAEKVMHSFMSSIQSLLQRYQSDPIRLKLLALTDSEKLSVMENTVRERPLPNDKEFVESVILTAKITFDKIGKYSVTRFQYDSTLSEATVTIPQSIGYVKLFIDNFSIPLDEKVELLVTVMEQNPNLVKDKLKKENLDRPQLYKWMKNMTNEKIGQLFLTVSGLDIEQIWREQKEFVLLKQIYISATAYGEDNSACTQGIWTQIIASLDEIDYKLLDLYEQYLNRESDRARLKPSISKDNISKLANDIARKLIEYAAFRPRVRKSLEEFVFGMINLKEFKNITFEQQKIIALLNREFTFSVKNFLPNYERAIPTEKEYDIIIENVLKSKILQDFAKGPTMFKR